MSNTTARPGSMGPAPPPPISRTSAPPRPVAPTRRVPVALTCLPHTRARRERRGSVVSLLAGAGGGPALELVDDAGVGEGGRVAEIAALGHIAQQAPHDLAAAGLGQIVGEDDRLGPGDRADL